MMVHNFESTSSLLPCDFPFNKRPVLGSFQHTKQAIMAACPSSSGVLGVIVICYVFDKAKPKWDGWEVTLEARGSLVRDTFFSHPRAFTSGSGTHISPTISKKRRANRTCS